MNQKTTDGVFHTEYKMNQLWLMFIKHKMHTNSDVFQQRFSEGRSTSEDKGNTQ